MSIGARTKLFLGHGATDRGLAGLVSERLRQAGLDVEAFLDARPGEGGEDFAARLRGPLAAADMLAFLVTPRFVGSPSFAFEIGAAMTLRKPIYVLYDGLGGDEIPDYLRRFPQVPVTELSRLIDEAAGVV